jgi:hypothetical protein
VNKKILYFVVVFLGNFNLLFSSESTQQTLLGKDLTEEFKELGTMGWDTEEVNITPIKEKIRTASSTPLKNFSTTEKNLSELKKNLSENEFYKDIINSIVLDFQDIQEKYRFYKTNSIENIQSFVNYFSAKLITIKKKITAFHGNLQSTFKTKKINFKYEVILKAFPELADYLDKLSELKNQLETHLTTITNQKKCLEHKDNHLRFFLNTQQLIPGYEFLERLEFISDDSIKNLIQQTKQNFTKNNTQLTPLGKLYINLAHYLYHLLEKSTMITELEKAKSFTFDDRTYHISQWNLFHVFLGSMWDMGFAGVHSKTIIPNIFTQNFQTTHQDDDDNQSQSNFYKLVPYHSDNRIEAGFIFYKTYQLQTLGFRDSYFNYYIKTSSFFPNSMNLKDCIKSVLKALSNIKFFVNNGNTYNFIGIDEEKDLAINIQYDIKNKRITTFYPMFYVDRDETVHQIKEKHTRYSSNSFQKTISERAYNEFMQFVQGLPDNQKQFEILSSNLNQLDKRYFLTQKTPTPTPQATPQGGNDDDDSGALTADGQSPIPGRIDSLGKFDRSGGSLTPLFQQDAGKSPIPSSPFIPSVLSRSFLDGAAAAVADAATTPIPSDPKKLPSEGVAQVESKGNATAVKSPKNPKSKSLSQTPKSDKEAQSTPPDQSMDPFEALELAFNKLVKIFVPENTGAAPAAYGGQGLSTQAAQVPGSAPASAGPTGDAGGSRSDNNSSGTSLDDEGNESRTPGIPKSPSFLPESFRGPAGA